MNIRPAHIKILKYLNKIEFFATYNDISKFTEISKTKVIKYVNELYTNGYVMKTLTRPIEVRVCYEVNDIIKKVSEIERKLKL